jgi:hypothetical protein
MSAPRDITTKATARHHHDFSITDTFSSSYLATSPIAQSILARDIAECSSEDVSDNEEGPDLDRAESNPAPLAFHPSGIAYGSFRPTVEPWALTTERHPPVPSAQEIEESRHAEQSLLRDNHILPPKHPRTEDDGVLTRLYRWVFSTKVRDSEDLFSRRSSKAVAETTPLLAHHVVEIGPVSPSGNEAHNRFEAAVAANIIKTTWQREAKTLVQYAGPLIVTFLLHYSVTIGSVLTVGRIGMVELGAVSCKDPRRFPDSYYHTHLTIPSGHHDSNNHLLRPHPRLSNLPRYPLRPSLRLRPQTPRRPPSPTHDLPSMAPHSPNLGAVVLLRTNPAETRTRPRDRVAGGTVSPHSNPRDPGRSRLRERQTLRPGAGPLPRHDLHPPHRRPTEFLPELAVCLETQLALCRCGDGHGGHAELTADSVGLVRKVL